MQEDDNKNMFASLTNEDLVVRNRLYNIMETTIYRLIYCEENKNVDINIMINVLSMTSLLIDKILKCAGITTPSEIKNGLMKTLSNENKDMMK